MVRERMEKAGLQVRVDAIGNLRGTYPGADAGLPRFLIGSHIDTVPGAGAFDGVLGVALGVAMVEQLQGRQLAFGIEIIAFSEEEGIRFGVPFLGSRALMGTVDESLLAAPDSAGITVEQAIRDFGLNPEELDQAAIRDDVAGYLEFHIEQGPVLESWGAPLGIVEAIAGQTRMSFTFAGVANHAGATPMHLRKDALAAAAAWITSVEREAQATPGLVATVGSIEVTPGVGNVIAANATCSLDVRHASDETRIAALGHLILGARRVAEERGLDVRYRVLLEQPAVAMDCTLSRMLEHAANAAGFAAPRMVSGAGHDAMIVAARIPTTMLFLRSPGGISHHPDETVLAGDVEAALQTGMRFLQAL